MLRFYVFIGLISLGVEAKSLELKRNTGTIFVQEKSNWVLGKDLFGMPFIYFSPQEHGQRSNISFTDTGAELDLDVKSLSSSQDKYRANKRSWSEKIGATPISFLPYEVNINSHGHRIHQIGFSYKHEDKIYHEKSYYIECRGKLIFSKSLRLSENKEHENDFSDLINSLDCGGV